MGQVTDLEPWPECECGNEFPPGRAKLGYTTCLDCGDQAAHAVERTVAPINKSNYVLISDTADLRGLNPKANNT